MRPLPMTVEASSQRRRLTTHSLSVGLFRCRSGLGSHKSLPKGPYHAEETRAARARRDLEPRGKPRREQQLVPYVLLTLGRGLPRLQPLGPQP